MFICPSTSYICFPHLLHYPYLFHEQTASLSGKTSPGSRNTQVLARAAACYNINRRDLVTVQFADIAVMYHLALSILAPQLGQ